MAGFDQDSGTEFGKEYWERHWAPLGDTSPRGGHRLPVHPYLSAETSHLPVGTALDAGCGTGAEASWLAEQGWQVTGADISATVLAEAASRAAGTASADRVEWVEADLSRWEPDRLWDLVVTSYAHASTGQLAFYERLGSWVAPGGSLLIVGHRHTPDAHHGHPAEATADLAQIVGMFGEPHWRVDAAYETSRSVGTGRTFELHDLVVRAHRRHGRNT